MVYEAMKVIVCYKQASVMPELLRHANKFICVTRRLFDLFTTAQAWDPKLDQLISVHNFSRHFCKWYFVTTCYHTYSFK